jgi:DNA repair protein RadC
MHGDWFDVGEVKALMPTREGRSVTLSEAATARLRQAGAFALSDLELLAVLGVANTEAELTPVLTHGLGLLIDAPELAFEVAPLLATRLFAAIELGRRVPLRRMERPRVFTPTGIARWARTQLFQHRVEEAWVVSLNSRNAVLRYDRVAQGGVSHCTIDPRDALAPAVACRAAAIVLVHSHPAGDPEPSVQDLALTRRIRAAAKLLNVVLVDHLVLTAEGHVSMLERGLLDHQAGAPLLVRQPFTDEED